MAPTTAHDEALRTRLLAHERYLRGLCYRMTGSAADADDLVQETFARALVHAPAASTAGGAESLRPWLVRVATNLARDAYRARRRRAYVGPWLPSPIDADDVIPAHEPRTTEGRYDLLESVSFAFLLALEVLRPRERAVLLLRDVLDYSVREAAEALAMSEANVKTTHHRARRAMEAYERTRGDSVASETHTAKTHEVLMRFMAGLAAQDAAAIEALLAESIVALNDGGGEYLAARIPIVGIRKVLTTHLKLSAHWPADTAVSLRVLNGMPAIVAARPKATTPPKQASRFVLMIDLDETGRIHRIYSVLAHTKLNPALFKDTG